MLKRVAGVLAGTVGAAAMSHAAAGVDDDPYELLTGELNGRLTMAIVNAQGTAVAVEFDEERGRIVRGIAAGAILSELRDTLGPRADVDHVVGSGADSSVVRLNGRLMVGKASRSETLAAINEMSELTEAQKAELVSLLMGQ